MKVQRLLKQAAQEAVEAETGDEWAALSAEAQAARRLLVLEVDCHNHFRNVWLGAITAALSARLREDLKEELEAIEPRLRVGVGIESLAARSRQGVLLVRQISEGAWGHV
eukprot:2608295-Pleurochrysis_carterae.AAC.3